MDGGGGGEHGFTNISATPAACEERQARFLRFLNEYVAQEADAEPASEPAQDEGAQITPPAARDRPRRRAIRRPPIAATEG